MQVVNVSRVPRSKIWSDNNVSPEADGRISLLEVITFDRGVLPLWIPERAVLNVGR